MSKKLTQYIHVIPHNKSWVVRGENISRVRSVHTTQRDAINAARKIAQKMNGELVIHSRDGRIRERDSYGSVPLPPKSPRKVLFPTIKSQTSEHEIRRAVQEVIQETRGRTQ